MEKFSEFELNEAMSYFSDRKKALKAFGIKYEDEIGKEDWFRTFAKRQDVDDGFFWGMDKKGRVTITMIANGTFVKTFLVLDNPNKHEQDLLKELSVHSIWKFK